MTNQTFPVVFRDHRFMVDPLLLYNSSKKFQELINSNNQDLHTLHLKISYDNFTPRNIENFLKICQNLQTDVQNSELEEICLIAKLFQADQIYNTGVIFIQNSIDSNFFIPYNKFGETNENQYIFLEQNDTNPLIHHINLKELEFDDSFDYTPVEHNKYNNNNTKIEKRKTCSVCYQITEENPLTKRARYYFSKDNTILYMAKVKKDEIYIAKGNDCHISENNVKNTVRIKRSSDGFNIVHTDDQEFKIKFVKFGEKYSLDISFTNKGTKLNWIPRIPKKIAEIYGQHNHIPIKSKKNIILQNSANYHPNFIVRKMSKKVVEVECHPLIDPIIAFAIAISHTIGPFH